MINATICTGGTADYGVKTLVNNLNSAIDGIFI